MAHHVESMAYVQETPWHGLGNQLSENQPVEVWLKEAGMDWEIKESPVQYQADDQDTLCSNPDAKVLYRSDNLKPLSVVSPRYKVVQPQEVLEFYRDLVSVEGFELETAGVLKGGRKFWALAKTGQEMLLKGKDLVKGYLLLATACDGTLATTAQFTSVRVVCNNTLQLATGTLKGSIKVPHSTTFNATFVKKELGLGKTAWNQFMDSVQILANRKVHRIEAIDYLVDVLGDPELPLIEQPNKKTLGTVFALFNGDGVGSGMASASGTGWGLVNAVTEYVDHQRRARSEDHRLDSAWFGEGAAIKQKALERALSLTA